MSRIQCPSEAWDDYSEREERNHYPTDDEMMGELDAYGHLSYVVGFSDEWAEDKVCDCPTVYKGGKVTEKPEIVFDEDKGPTCKKCGGREYRGDWLACFDYHIYTDADCMTKLAYHVVWVLMKLMMSLHMVSTNPLLIIKRGTRVSTSPTNEALSVGASMPRTLRRRATVDARRLATVRRWVAT